MVENNNEKHVFKILNNVASHLITWGNPFDCNGQDVIVCITGNPGITDFYKEFGSELHKQTSLPVCVIGHAGHEEVPHKHSDKLEGEEKLLFNLQGQIEHKLDLIKNNIDKGSKLHIIGHSIGAWMTIELMDKNDFMQDRVLTTNLLFPTVQKMAESKNGIFLNGTVRWLHSVIMFLVYLLPMLPDILYKFLVSCYIKYHKLPMSYSERIYKFLSPKSVEKVLLLAYDEMDNVTELNEKGVKKLCLHTNVIYSTRDNWVPVEYVEDLKAVQPKFELNKVDIGHAFVLKSSERVAWMVSEFIKPKISKR